MSIPARWLLLLPIVCAVSATACGGGGAATPDAATTGPDAPIGLLQPCTLAPGRSWVFRSFTFLGPDTTHDFGDGVQRNGLQSLPSGIINGYIMQGVEKGAVRFGMHIDGFQGAEPPLDLATDALKTMELLDGPGGVADFDGGTFCADPQQFNVDCSSWSHSEHISVTSSGIEATSDVWPIVARSFGVGTLEFHHAVLDLSKAMDGGSWDTLKVVLFGIWPACSLANTVGPNSASLLDFVTSFNIFPDFDLGTNRGVDPAAAPIFSTAGGVTTCTLDGETVTGGHCACDPRITLGYSVAIRFDGVAAEVPALCDE
jgi:hypothetical protein